VILYQAQCVFHEKFLLNTGGIGPVRNLVSTGKDDKRIGIWDTRSSNDKKQ